MDLSGLVDGASIPEVAWPVRMSGQVVLGHC